MLKSSANNLVATELFHVETLETLSEPATPTSGSVQNESAAASSCSSSLQNVQVQASFFSFNFQEGCF
jgi:hypothetical protein